MFIYYLVKSVKYDKLCGRVCRWKYFVIVGSIVLIQIPQNTQAQDFKKAIIDSTQNVDQAIIDSTISVKNALNQGRMLVENSLNIAKTSLSGADSTQLIIEAIADSTTIVTTAKHLQSVLISNAKVNGSQGIINSLDHGDLFKFRLLAGIEQSLAQGSKTEIENFRFIQTYFESIIIRNRDKSKYLSLYGDVRFTSVAAIDTFENKDTKIKELVLDNSKSVSLIIGALYPVYRITDNGSVTSYLTVQYGFNTGTENTSTSNKFRRFDRELTVGFRTRFRPANNENVEAYFDLTYGRIETNRNNFGAGQLKLEGLFPISYFLSNPGDRKNDFYLSGTALLDLDTKDLEKSNALDSWRFAITYRANELLRNILNSIF